MDETTLYEENQRLHQRVQELEHMLHRHAHLEAEIQRREAILQAVGNVAEYIAGDAPLEQYMHRALTTLGQATRVSRVYIFENFTKPDTPTRFMRQRYEWAAPGIPPQIDDPLLQRLTYDELGFERWATALEQGQAIFGDVQTFPEPERAVLEPQDILSIVVVPIFSGQQWWGFIGFDECVNQRSWSTSEVAALKVAAGIIGAAIHRQQVEVNRESQRTQEQHRHIQEALLRELSIPLIPIADDVIILPLIGTFDPQRAQVMLETLLDGIAVHRATTVILDITGVRTIDTAVASTFVQAAQAVKLLGARLILTGIQSQVAHMLVQLGTDLSGIITTSTLQAGVHYVLKERHVRHEWQ